MPDIKLRHFRTDDYQVYVDLLNNQVIAERSGMKNHLSSFESWMAFRSLIENNHHWVIEYDGQMAGFILFFSEEDVHNFEVGYVLGQSFWNQGIMTQALKIALHNMTVENPSIKKFTAGTWHDNLASQVVLQKNDFTRVPGEFNVVSAFDNSPKTEYHLEKLV
ncbi:GNAT family N-acetyltransferase [Pediococcus argentinicus]|uniref:GNAT family N-acetyltransferase n=1 Tax=Pediococcus argentinicus TaxID=480391 RepID=UPI00338FA711